MCAEHSLSIRTLTPCEVVVSDALVTNVIAHGSTDDSWVDESEMGMSDVFSGKACSTALSVVGTEEDEVAICALHSSSECVRVTYVRSTISLCPLATERLLLDIVGKVSL